MNVGKNSPLQEKKKTLRNVAQALIDKQEPDFLLRIKAVGSKAALDADLGLDVEMEPWLNAEIEGFKEELEKKLGSMEVDGGRRKKKTRKNRRKTQTRRR